MKTNQLKWGRLRRFYNIVNHYEWMQSLIIVIGCVLLMIAITLYCLLFV